MLRRLFQLVTRSGQAVGQLVTVRAVSRHWVHRHFSFVVNKCTVNIKLHMSASHKCSFKESTGNTVLHYSIIRLTWHFQFILEFLCHFVDTMCWLDLCDKLTTTERWLTLHILSWSCAELILSWAMCHRLPKSMPNVTWIFTEKLKIRKSTL